MYTEVCFTPISYSLKKKLFRQEKKKKRRRVGWGRGVQGLEALSWFILLFGSVLTSQPEPQGSFTSLPLRISHEALSAMPHCTSSPLDANQKFNTMLRSWHATLWLLTSPTSPLPPPTTSSADRYSLVSKAETWGSQVSNAVLGCTLLSTCRPDLVAPRRHWSIVCWCEERRGGCGLVVRM